MTTLGNARDVPMAPHPAEDRLTRLETPAQVHALGDSARAQPA